MSLNACEKLNYEWWSHFATGSYYATKIIQKFRIESILKGHINPLKTYQRGAFNFQAVMPFEDTKENGLRPRNINSMTIKL